MITTLTLRNGWWTSSELDTCVLLAVSLLLSQLDPAQPTMPPIAKMTDVLETIAHQYAFQPVALQSWRARSNVLLYQLFQRCCTTLDVTALLECGAHGAETSSQFLAAEANRLAVAIEANPHTCEKLTRLTEQHGVVVINAGVGPAVDRRTLWVPNQHAEAEPVPGNASLLRRTDSTENYLGIDIDITTVDRLVAQYCDDRRLALWIDVEGLGLDVLKGAVDTLQSGQCQLIHIEVEAHRYWHEQALAQDIDLLLVDQGYIAIARDSEYELQYNLLYARRDTLPALQEQIDRYWRSAGQLGPLLRLRLWIIEIVPKWREGIRSTLIAVIGEQRWRWIRNRRSTNNPKK